MENIFRLSISIEPNTALDKLKKKKNYDQGIGSSGGHWPAKIGDISWGGGGGVVGWQIVGIGGWRFS